MKSRTSSCKAALWKDITRFWPVWALYILLHIFIQVLIGNEGREYWYLATLMQTATLMSVVNCGYGLLTALALFGDLFNTRMCSGIHSLPLKRETWFGVHLTSGMLFSLVPTALVAAFVEAVMVPGTIITGGWQLPLYWWVICNLEYLFFFGLAVFCIMCTGSWFASAIIYGVTNSFSLLLWLLVDQFYTPLLHGVVTQSRAFRQLSPVWWLNVNEMAETHRTRTGNTYLDKFGVEQEEYTANFLLNGENWAYLGILTAIAVVLLVVARQMYKKRQLEKAGDFMAVKWLEPVFQVVFTVFCAAVAHGFFSVFFGYQVEGRGYLMALLGLVAGWFAARMLLDRSTRVFRAKHIGGLVLLTAVLAASLFITKLDPLGIEDWMPEAGQVQKAQLVLSHNTDIMTEDPEEIADFLAVHAGALEEKLTVGADYTDYFYYDNSIVQQGEPVAFVSLTYWMENGRTAERQYYIRPDSEAGQIAREYASRLVEVIDRKDQIKSLDDLRYAMKKVNYVTVQGLSLGDAYMNEAYLVKLAEAINADCEAGSMVQSNVYHPEYIVEGALLWQGETPAVEQVQEMAERVESTTGMHSVHLDMSGEDLFFYVKVYADCKNTLAVLEESGIMDAVRAQLPGKALG